MIHLLEVVVKVAIIGAGISGIGSSREFSKNGVEHIIIEARNRIGGRITSTVFEGATVQLGAELLHLTKEDNPLLKVLTEQKLEFDRSLLFTNMSFYEPGVGQLGQAAFRQAHEVKADLAQKARKSANYGSKERSIQYALDEYFGKIKNQTPAMHITKWLATYVGLYTGADLTDLSENQFHDAQMSQPGIYVKGGYANFIRRLYSKAFPKKVHLNRRVTMIDYSGDIVKIYAGNRVFLAEKVIVTLPLGVLKQNNVKFIPQLSDKRKEAIKTMGFGVFNKIFVSFESPFWDTTKKTLGFVKQNGTSRYPFARYIPDSGKHILAFFTAGSESLKVSKMCNEERKADIVSFLRQFYPKAKIVIKDLIMTRWHEDPFALGSYSFEEIGTNISKLIPIICEPLNNKVWFAGQHCHLADSSFSHSAFETGIWAAGNITSLLLA